MKRVVTFTLEDLLEQFAAIAVERDSVQHRLNQLYMEHNQAQTKIKQLEARNDELYEALDKPKAGASVEEEGHG
jgi:peptidoglycan hydrolase CwlO-like protein